MCSTDWIAARDHRGPVICPACGESDYRDCHFDLSLHRELEREASGLVQEGRSKEAIEMLSELYARRISNIVNPHWRCLFCGAKFDA